MAKKTSTKLAAYYDTNCRFTGYEDDDDMTYFDDDYKERLAWILSDEPYTDLANDCY